MKPMVSIIDNLPHASFTKKYRFTLHESDTRELSEYVNDYKYGIGLSFGQEKHSGVNVSLSEHVG